MSEPLPPIHTTMLRWFTRYVRWSVGRKFNAVRWSAETDLPELNRTTGPLVVYLNHPSWWDPLMALLVYRRFFPNRRAYAPIDARALEQYSFFRKLGFFGVEQDSPRGGMQFLRLARRIVQHDDSMLWITGQGQFADVRQRPVQLAPGLAHLAKNMKRGSIIPMALEYNFWEESKPEAFIRLGSPIIIQDATRTHTKAWQQQLEQALTRQMDLLSRHVIAREPKAFAPLITGRSGVGVIYDTWRRVKALCRGRKFDARHNPQLTQES